MAWQTIPRGDVDLDKGVWKGGTYAGGRTALVSCPKCGQIASLSYHEIDENGFVSPSVVCPAECGFHEYIHLSEWKASQMKPITYEAVVVEVIARMAEFTADKYVLKEWIDEVCMKWFPYASDEDKNVIRKSIRAKIADMHANADRLRQVEGD